MSAPVPAKYRRYWPVAVTLAAGLILTAAIGWELHREAEELDRKRFALRMEEFTDQLDGRIEKTEQLMRQLQDYLMLSGDTRSRVLGEWLGARVPDNFPWLHGIAIATNRLRAEWRQAIPQPVSTWSSNEWSLFRMLARTQAVDCVMGIVGRTQARRKFLADYDLQAEFTKKSELHEALVGNHVRITGCQPVMLDRRNNVLSGAMMFVPVYEAGVPDFLSRSGTTTSARDAMRWQHLDSVILAPIDFTALVKAVWDGREADLGVEVFASTNRAASTWLNPSGPVPRAIAPNFTASLTQARNWPMFTRRYSLFFHSTPLFEAQSPHRIARTVVLAGLGLTGLATLLIAVVLRARFRQERMMAQVIDARDALAAAERERVRLGHDLHDGAIQSLYAIQLGLTRTAEGVAASLPAAARVLGETRERVDEVIAELRQFILARETDAARAEPGGLERVLTAMIQRLQPTTGTKLQFHAEPGASERLSLSQTVQLAQIARSALANSLRHAQARQVKLALRHSPRAVVLEIADDGIGFDPSLSGDGGMGLHTMQARATEAGGTLEVETRPGAGTRVVVEVSVTEADTPEVESP